MKIPGQANIAHALDDLIIVEIGSRVATGVCGSLLAQAGANVVFVEPPTWTDSTNWKWTYRDLFAAGKETLTADLTSAEDWEDCARLIRAADAVLLSTDVDPHLRGKVESVAAETSVVCNFTALGKDAAGDCVMTDSMVQSIAGIAFTTGFSDGPPVVLNVPVMEYSAGAYGASAVLAAIRARSGKAAGQSIDISLYDCAINSLTTFLPSYFGGQEPGRLGNGHAMAMPWNAYHAIDGWVMICSATDPQWGRICQMMSAQELVADPRFSSLGARVENRQALDKIVGEWVAAHSVAECVERLDRSGTAHGLILPANSPEADHNLVHRGMVNELRHHSTATAVRVPGTLLKAGGGNGRIPASFPSRDSARSKLGRLSDRRKAGTSGRKVDLGRDLPFEGLKVVEIGQYTTAPLVGKHLAALGADVTKVEPPVGDAARAWLPARHGIGLFFFMSNCGKDSVALDLKSHEGKNAFVRIIEEADVFIENLRPGSMARLGLGPHQLHALNPRLVYCQITGFGTDSVYRDKPAYDTVVQAASGLMDANSFEGIPLKAGVSVADFMGGEVGLYGVIAALHQRDRTGQGQYLDLSMQDVASWMTAPLWGASSVPANRRLVSCTDGHVLCEADPQDGDALAELHSQPTMSREEFIRTQRRDNVSLVPVRCLSEVAQDQLTRERGLIAEVANDKGESWPVLRSPMRFSVTSPALGYAIGQPRDFLRRMPRGPEVSTDAAVVDARGTQ